MPFLMEENGQDQGPRPVTTNTQENDEPDEVRLATAKQVAYLKSQIKNHKITQKEFFDNWAEEFESWDDIPFHKVNSILEWIREI